MDTPQCGGDLRDTVHAAAWYAALAVAAVTMACTSLALLVLDIRRATAWWLTPIDRTSWILTAVAIIAAGHARDVYRRARRPSDTLVEVRELRSQLEAMLAVSPVKREEQPLPPGVAAEAFELGKRIGRRSALEPWGDRGGIGD